MVVLNFLYPKIKRLRMYNVDKYLNNIMSEQNIKIYFYSTTRDRDTNAEEMYKVLDSIEVSYVPMFLECEAGIIQNTFSFDNEVELKKLLKVM